MGGVWQHHQVETVTLDGEAMGNRDADRWWAGQCSGFVERTGELAQPW